MHPQVAQPSRLWGKGRPASIPAGQDRILVFRTGQLGDMIVSLPAMWAIRHQWPQASLTLLSDVHPKRSYVLGSEIFRDAGLFDHFEHYDVPAEPASRWATAFSKFKLLRRLRSSGFKTLVYLAPSIRKPVQVERDRRFFKAAGLRRFYGMGSFPPVPYHQPTHPMPAAGHEADLILSRLRADGINAPGVGQGSLDLQLGDDDTRTVDQWLAPLSSDGARPWIGVGPASKMPAKRWPPDRFRDVVQALISHFDVWPVVFGGPEDQPLAAELVESLGRGYNAAGTLGLRAAASALGRCAIYLGTDSGTMHLAAVAGTPCVAVFSSRDWPGAWYPYGVEQRVFRSDIECDGCYLTECVERKNECLTRITVAQVLAGCTDLLTCRLPAAAVA